MTKYGFKHLPVVKREDQQHVIGEVTLADIGMIQHPRELLYHISGPISGETKSDIIEHTI